MASGESQSAGGHPLSPGNRPVPGDTLWPRAELPSDAVSARPAARSNGPCAAGNRNGANDQHGEPSRQTLASPPLPPEVSTAPTDQQSPLAPQPATPPPLKEQIVRDAPPWLTSMIVHLLLVLLLGLMVVRRDGERPVQLQATISSLDNTEIDDSPVMMSIERPADETVMTPEDLMPVDDPFAAPPELDITFEGQHATSDVAAPRIGSALAGRQDGMKQALVESYGGSGQSEAAVLEGLRWLARQQLPDGSWSLKGPYADGSLAENHAAATAMALLAFQGAGHTHLHGAFREQVDRGRRFLLSLQDSSGNFFQSGPYDHQLYTQAQATIAICELLAMSGDESLREPARRAVEYCVAAQDRRKGGWRYHPGRDSDTSVTGWMVMALKSAEMAGIDVPAATWQRVEQFLDTAASHDGSRYAYTPGGAPTAPMTAEGLLCRQYLGWSRDDPRLLRGAEHILAKLPNWSDRDVYYWYYATQVMHHMGGEPWERWNAAMRDLLVVNQVQSGTEVGSWHPTRPTEDRYGFRIGRLYVTCLSLYILEVYYRHLPLYAADLAGG